MNIKSPFDVDIISYYPKVTQRDIDRGYFVRYFLARGNHVNDVVFEVEKDEYRRLKYDPYIVHAYVNWVIKGDLHDKTRRVYVGERGLEDYIEVVIPGVISQNRAYVNYVADWMPAIKRLLTNYEQFYVD